MIPALNESIRYTKTPSFCVELIWASGIRVMAMPVAYLSSADWRRNEEDEQIDCHWGDSIITLRGHGLQRLPGALIRGEVCAIIELESERADVTVGTVVTKILAIEKKPEK